MNSANPRQLITVREYARLTTEDTASTLDRAQISQSAFNWLCDQQSRSNQSGTQLTFLEGRRWLRLDNYVGLITTPCGTTIEILPKHALTGDDAIGLRKLLIRMIGQALDIKPKTYGPADLALFNYPLSEWVLSRFLNELDGLVKRGVRFDYQNIHEESRYVRGRLNLGRQISQPPGRAHLFHIQHDIYTPDRSENRLLKLALIRTQRLTRHPGSWRLANELLQYLEPIPESMDIASDFRSWRNDRLLSRYRAVKPWTELILNRMNPMAQMGDWSGISLLFPMERLFERFVASCLARCMSPGSTLKKQPARHSLCTHEGQSWFSLQPDLLVENDEATVVLDTKWKRLDQSKGNNWEKYNLSQTDFYQLFAYGHRYMTGAGNLFLIFPRTSMFSKSLPPFHFSEKMKLWVVPFDLKEESLVAGDWISNAPWFKPAHPPL